jgi:hypothetical protein
MKIEEKLIELLVYYQNTRGKGHTALLKEGTNHYTGRPIFVLAHKKAFAWRIGIRHNLKKILSPIKTSIASEAIIRPMAIDNGAMIELLSESLMRIEALQEENKKLEKQNQLILVSPTDKLVKKIEKLEKELETFNNQSKINKRFYT